MSQENPMYDDVLDVARWIECSKRDLDKAHLEAVKVPRLQNSLLQSEGRARELIAEISKLNSQVSLKNIARGEVVEI